MVRCPECRSEIPQSDFNVSTDRLWCAKCGKLYSFRELPVEEVATPVRSGGTLPAGCKRFQTLRGDEVFEASLYSNIWLFLVPFTAFWGGLSMTGMVSSIRQRGFQLETLFFLPFFVGTIVLTGASLFSLFGKLRVKRSAADGKIICYQGCLGIGKTWRLEPSEIKSFRIITGIGGRNSNSYYLEVTFKNGDRKRIFFTGQEEKLRFAHDFLYTLVKKHLD